MKFFKIIFISLILVPLLFLLLTNSNQPNLAGDWTAKQITLKGKQIYPTEIDKFLTTDYQVKIDVTSDSIFLYQDHISAHFQRTKGTDTKEYFILTSKQNALNGTFNLDIDTVHIGPQSYKVNLKLQSGNSVIQLQRIVNIGPWRPEFPRRGQV